MIGSNNQDFRKIPAMWPEIQGRRALDVGCGVGLYTRELGLRGAVAVGVDLDLGNLRRAKSCDCGQRLVCADAARLPFQAGVFDIVLSIEVLGHISPDDRLHILADICRVMCCKGMAFLTLHNRRRLTLSCWLRLRRMREVFHTQNLDVWPSRPEEIQAMAVDSGLVTASSAKYLNFHSRFTYSFFVKYPQLSRVVIAIEDLLSKLPILRLLAITFLLVAVKQVVIADSVSEKCNDHGQ